MGEQQPKTKYPKSVFFIIGNEFCERFTFYGIRTVLSLYLHQELGYTKDTATAIYHAFIFMAYFSPLLGAIIADSVVGKFITIMVLSVVYAAGNIILSVSAIPNVPQIPFTILGLVVIAIGTGGIKPCVSAFGAEQFKLPEQSAYIQSFFSMFYFSINLGSLISTYITPLLREEVECFDKKNCYTLAFGVPAGLMIIAILIFVIGKPWYIIKKPEGSTFLRAMGAICRASCVKCKEKRSYWLDKADDKYSKEFIQGIQAAFHVMILFIPVPIFWALYDQQGSRWTFQATRMNGHLGENYIIQPDQMQVVNPLLILAFIPIFDYGLYPLLGKCKLLRKPLQRIATGGILAALAFVVSAVLETQLELTYPVFPKAGESQIRLYNPLPCKITMKSPDLSGKDIILESLSKWENLNVPVKLFKNFEYDIERRDCFQGIAKGKLTLYEKSASTFVLTPPNKMTEIKNEVLDKTKDSVPIVRVIYIDLKPPPAPPENANVPPAQENPNPPPPPENPNPPSPPENPSPPQVRQVPGPENTTPSTTSKKPDEKPKILTFKDSSGQIGKPLTFTSDVISGVVEELTSKRVDVFLDGQKIISQIRFEQGGVFALMITKDPNGAYKYHIETTTTPNTIHILWMVPQYVVMTAAEIMLSITGLQFAFTQAPHEMKSLITAFWLLTVALGNLLVTIIANFKIFESQTWEFVLFAGLMVLDMIVFSLLAWWYKYKNYEN